MQRFQSNSLKFNIFKYKFPNLQKWASRNDILSKFNTIHTGSGWASVARKSCVSVVFCQEQWRLSKHNPSCSCDVRRETASTSSIFEDELLRWSHTQASCAHSVNSTLTIKKQYRWDRFKSYSHLENRLRHPQSTWMLSPARRPAVTLTFHLWPSKSKHVIIGGCWVFPISCIEIDEAIHKISW